MHSRKEIVKANYQAYQEAGKKGRKELLDRLEPVTGMNRDYLATVLGNYGRSREERQVEGAGGGRGNTVQSLFGC
jgi:hypothetical protein